jgi:4-hydroxy-tetrahydrodipicolinate synthase
MGYPKLAKLYHRRRGRFKSVYSRAVPDDITKTFWALDAVLEKIEIGTVQYRSRIANLRDHQ